MKKSALIVAVRFAGTRIRGRRRKAEGAGYYRRRVRSDVGCVAGVSALADAGHRGRCCSLVVASFFRPIFFGKYFSKDKTP